MDPWDFLSPSGRLARGPFVAAVILVYVASFASQALLSVPGRGGIWLFAAAQAALVWVWYVVHARRLHDAGLGSGAALGIALVYALAVVLLVLLLFVLTPAGSAGGDPMQLKFLLIFYVMLAGLQATASGFSLVAALMLAAVLAPVGIALVFSLHTALRRSVPVAP